MKKTTLIYVSVVFALGASVLNVVSSMHDNVVPVYLYLMTACLLVTVVLQCILFKKLKDENISADESL